MKFLLTAYVLTAVTLLLLLFAVPMLVLGMLLGGAARLCTALTALLILTDRALAHPVIAVSNIWSHHFNTHIKPRLTRSK